MYYRKLFSAAALAALGLSTAFALGSYHRRVQTGESYHQFYSFPKGGARPVILKYGERGILHRVFSPNTLEGTLGLTNSGKPAKVTLSLENVPDDLEVHWDSAHTRNFNLEAKTLDRVLGTGESFSVHHTFRVGQALRKKPLIYNGGLNISETDTGKLLLRIPIRITNNGIKAEQAGGKCHGM
jgi:hypothetical protein